MLNAIKERTNLGDRGMDKINLLGRLCGLVVEAPVYSCRGPGSILGATTLSEK
jgi:hypothetical protein